MRAARKVAPDGGWGWVATFGVSLVNLCTRSIEPSFGLLFGDLLKDLEVGTTGAAIIMSALDVMMNFSGLFVGPLLKEFSYRKVAIAGSFLCTLGLALTSFASSMPHILATYSVINGIGVGLATSAAFVALNHYFKKRRGQAVGLSMAGTALGMLIMPQLVRILLEGFGFRGAVLLLSGLALHAVVGATLLQPAKWHLKEEEVDIELVPVPQEVKPIQPIQEDDEDELPEITTLLYDNKRFPAAVGGGEERVRKTSRLGMPNGMKKNFSEMAIGTIATTNGMVKRPTFPRIMSNEEMTMEIRKRKQSVISNLSHLDFSGSYLQIHVNTGDDDNDDIDYEVIRRVKTHVGMSSLNSFTKPTKVGSINTIQSEIGLQMLKPKKQNFWKRFSSIMDLDILRDRIYLNILFGLSIFYVAEMNFKMVTPFFLANLGYAKADVAFCLSITAITDILARVILPPICDRLLIPKRHVFMVAIFFVGITRSIIAEQTGWTALIVWLSISGFFRGAALSNFTLTVSEYCTLEKLPAAFGWHMVGKAIFVVALGPLIGVIRDITGSYPICIHAQTFCIMMCCLAWTIELLWKYFSRRMAPTK
uniref:Putative monocarboxylate transporter n=1 Tax=Lutzomyia longipalpis TaxID=7200 RepID=A0A7G3ARK7_LUTLO